MFLNSRRLRHFDHDRRLSGFRIQNAQEAFLIISHRRHHRVSLTAVLLYYPSLLVVALELEDVCPAVLYRQKIDLLRFGRRLEPGACCVLEQGGFDLFGGQI